MTEMKTKIEKDGAEHTYCISCIKGKRTQDVIPKKSDTENPRKLYKIYSNICGLFDVERYS